MDAINYSYGVEKQVIAAIVRILSEFPLMVLEVHYWGTWEGRGTVRIPGI